MWVTSAVYYIPDFVTLAEEAEISAQLAGSPEEMWRSMAGRRVQECGTMWLQVEQGCS